MENDDNDIELLAGQVWNAPARPDWAQRMLEATATFLKPQAEVVRRAPRPEESELLHEAPHYDYLLPKKGE